MLNSFNRLGKAVTVAALTVGVVFAQPAQKASAQVTGAGTTTVINLLKDNVPAGNDGPVWDYVNRFGFTYNYFGAGSGLARNVFNTGYTNGNSTTGINIGLIDFVASDGPANVETYTNGTPTGRRILGTVPPSVAPGSPLTPLGGVNTPYSGSLDIASPNVVAVNEATLNVAFPVNVNGGGISLTITQACDVINGNVTNWSQVGGPNLAIRRVTFADVAGTTATLNQGFVTVPAPNGCGSPPINNPPFDSSGQSTLPNARRAGSVDPISGKDDSDILVFPPANPFASSDHSNSSAFTIGVVNAVKNNPGAAGYAEVSVARSLGANLAVNTGTGLSVVVGGPTYIVFRANYLLPNGQQDSNKVASAQDVCYGAIFSGYEGNQAGGSGGIYPKEAGFNINNAGAQFPYAIAGSTQQGDDTDNYGSYGAINNGSTFFDFGPCSRIGVPGFANETFTAGITGSTLTSITGSPRTTLQVGDTLSISSGTTVIRATVTGLTPTTVTAVVWVSNSSTFPVVFNASGSAIAYTFNR